MAPFLIGTKMSTLGGKKFSSFLIFDRHKKVNFREKETFLFPHGNKQKWFKYLFAWSLSAYYMFPAYEVFLFLQDLYYNLMHPFSFYFLLFSLSFHLAQLMGGWYCIL